MTLSLEDSTQSVHRVDYLLQFIGPAAQQEECKTMDSMYLPYGLHDPEQGVWSAYLLAVLVCNKVWYMATISRLIWPLRYFLPFKIFGPPNLKGCRGSGVRSLRRNHQKHKVRRDGGPHHGIPRQADSGLNPLPFRDRPNKKRHDYCYKTNSYKQAGYN